MSKTKQSTQDLILAEAEKIARADGLEAVSHKVIATALGKSSSNIVYYYPTALHLRRAAAQRILAADGGPQWGVIEFYVLHRLPEDHPGWLDRTAPISQEVEGQVADGERMRNELLVAEAFLWLARHGVADPMEAEGE